jgi:tetratricopeptide (TPR) repeat protein
MTTTQRSPSRIVALALLAGAALAGCQTVTGSPTTEIEDNQLAASPANLASLSGVVQNNPNDPQAYNMRGSVYGQSGRNDEALADFNKAVSLDPNYGQAYSNRGLIYRKTGARSRARRLQQGVTLDPNYAAAARPRYRLSVEEAPFGAFRTSTRRSRSAPTTPRPITTAGLLYQSQSSTSSRSTISRPRSAHQNQANPIRRALELHGDQRLQGGGGRSSTSGVGGAAEPAGLDDARLCL